MLDAGLLDYYKSLYLRNWDKGATPLGPQKDGQPVTLSELYLVLLYVFAGGLCLASAILIFENLLKLIRRVRVVVFSSDQSAYYSEEKPLSEHSYR